MYLEICKGLSALNLDIVYSKLSSENSLDNLFNLFNQCNLFNLSNIIYIYIILLIKYTTQFDLILLIHNRFICIPDS